MAFFVNYQIDSLHFGNNRKIIFYLSYNQSSNDKPKKTANRQKKTPFIRYTFMVNYIMLSRFDRSEEVFLLAIHKYLWFWWNLYTSLVFHIKGKKIVLKHNEPIILYPKRYICIPPTLYSMYSTCTIVHVQYIYIWYHIAIIS